MRSMAARRGRRGPVPGSAPKEIASTLILVSPVSPAAPAAVAEPAGPRHLWERAHCAPVGDGGAVDQVQGQAHAVAAPPLATGHRAVGKAMGAVIRRVPNTCPNGCPAGTFPLVRAGWCHAL